ncbi:unnamed protein product [Ectocarpus fasciculatus]
MMRRDHHAAAPRQSLPPRLFQGEPAKSLFSPPRCRRRVSTSSSAQQKSSRPRALPCVSWVLRRLVHSLSSRSSLFSAGIIVSTSLCLLPTPPPLPPPPVLLLRSFLCSSPRPRADSVDDDDFAVVHDLDLDLFTLVALALLVTITVGRVDRLAIASAAVDSAAGARQFLSSSSGVVVRGGRCSSLSEVAVPKPALVQLAHISL